jgi:CRP-like cAMP-binding protein
MVISGLVRLQYEPTEELVNAYRDRGIVPNTEFLLDLSFTSSATDYMGTGTMIGELGVLTNLPRAASIVCETNVTLFHWSQQAMERGLTTFDDPYDSLESRLWRNFGIKLAAEFLHTQGVYSV